MRIAAAGWDITVGVATAAAASALASPSSLQWILHLKAG